MLLNYLSTVRIIKLSNHKITTTQQNIWIVTAVIGPIIFWSDGNWPGVLIWGAGISLLCWCAVRYGRHWSGVIYNIVQCLWLSVVLSQVLPYSAECWPTGERTFPVVPLALLALAAVSALKDSKATAGGISVLFWVAAFLIGIVLAAGVPELNSGYLLPQKNGIGAQIILVFLIPAAAGFLHREKTVNLPFVLVVVLGAAVAVWISGILSPKIAGTVQWPFYEAAKSVQLFDVAKRLESLVSAGVTVGNYALYSLLLCSIRNIGDKFHKGREAVVISAGISASLMLLELIIDTEILVIVCLILWLFLPLLGVIQKKRNE